MTAICDRCRGAHGYDHDAGRELVDPCLGRIAGAWVACCGHGNYEQSGAYVGVAVHKGADYQRVVRDWLARRARAGLRTRGMWLVEVGNPPAIAYLMSEVDARDWVTSWDGPVRKRPFQVPFKSNARQYGR